MIRATVLLFFLGRAILAQEAPVPYPDLVKEYEAASKADHQGAAKQFVPRFVEAAAARAGREEAVPFLLWVVENARAKEFGDQVRGALATLLETHIASPQLSRLPWALYIQTWSLGTEAVQAALTTLVEKSPHPAVQATALHRRAEMVGGRGAVDAEALAAARADCKRAIELAPGNPSYTGLLFEIENLQVGMVAPEIEGKDLDGVDFKLSDYRGQVVLLDFWGDW